MFRAPLASAAWLHRGLEARIGLPYRLLIAVGLIITIVRGLRDNRADGWGAASAMSLLLQFALLLDSATSLHERFQRRDHRRTGR